MSYHDLFSNHAADYATHRPDYPANLFEYLATLTPTHQLAWDCATGNGQAAHGLTPYFEQIIATDASAQQLKQAKPHSQITYRTLAAEQTDFPAHSVDLICVAQALHWFNFAEFYPEVKRILKPTGVLAAWTYTVIETTNTVLNNLLHDYYWKTLADYWRPELSYSDAAYKTLPLPFKQVTAPQFTMARTWSLAQLVGYLKTWSAAQTYLTQHGKDSLELIYPQLCAAWGDLDKPQTFSWPIFMLVGLPTSGLTAAAGLPVAPL